MQWTLGWNIATDDGDEPNLFGLAIASVRKSHTEDRTCQRVIVLESNVIARRSTLSKGVQRGHVCVVQSTRISMNDELSVIALHRKWNANVDAFTDLKRIIIAAIARTGEVA